MADHSKDDIMDDPSSAWDYPKHDPASVSTDKSGYSFIQAPKVVGHYCLEPSVYGGDRYVPLALQLTHKPNWLHRLCMRVFLGFEWMDAP